MTTMVASSITQLRTTIRSRLAIDWKIRRPRPRQVEHVLDHDGAGQQIGELQPHHRHDRDHGVAQHGSTAPRACRGLFARAVRTKSSRSTSSTAERVTRARIAACTTASETAGSSSDLTPSQIPSSQPGKPPAESHCSLHREQQDQEDREPEVRQRDAHLRQRHHADIAELVVVGGGVDAGRERQRDRDRHRHDRERNRQHQPLRDQASATGVP